MHAVAHGHADHPENHPAQHRGHSHAPALARSGERHRTPLLIAFVLTAAFLVVEAVAAFVTGSLALLSDAGHMLTDVLGLGMALAAITLASRFTGGGRHTFGLYRLEILAAFVNALLLFGVAFPLGWIDPPDRAHLLAVASHPLTRLVLLGTSAFSLIHFAHRFRYTLYDGLQVKMKRTVAVLCYGAAIVGSVATLAVLWAAAREL